jgi:vesicle coat complex subunit
MNNGEDEKELIKDILKELTEISKEIRRIANYLEVIAEKSSIEAMAKWGRIIKIKKEE